MFNRLLDMARQGSPDSKRELFGAVSELFAIGADRYNDRETTLFGEILCQLLTAAPIDDRVHASTRIAKIAQTPRALALRLADDEPLVATPILEFSNSLTDDDLANLSGSKTDDHRMAIARRVNLPEIVTDALVDHGGEAVLQTVTRNHGARFSGRGMALLADRAAGNALLAEALALRTDLPAHIVEAIIRIVSPAAMKRLAAMMRHDADRIGAIVADVTQNMAAAREIDERNRAEAQEMTLDIRRNRRSIDDVVLTLLSNARTLDLHFVLADLTDVDEAHVANAMNKPTGTAIAAICRRLDMSLSTYAEMTRARAMRLSLSRPICEAMLMEYRDLSKETATSALRFHQARNHRSVRR